MVSSHQIRQAVVERPSLRKASKAPVQHRNAVSSSAVSSSASKGLGCRLSTTHGCLSKEPHFAACNGALTIKTQAHWQSMAKHHLCCRSEIEFPESLVTALGYRLPESQHSSDILLSLKEQCKVVSP